VTQTSHINKESPNFFELLADHTERRECARKPEAESSEYAIHLLPLLGDVGKLRESNAFSPMCVSGRRLVGRGLQGGPEVLGSGVNGRKMRTDPSVKQGRFARE
jgi:hypothetical protein